ncbi:MAG: hypothetical protein LQ341_003280 [Variospora aurantia]|nr:MAG: hypothetical protein LQ341_003280 [Variospora aurantia]
MFGRSQSGPGSLSINTTQANTNAASSTSQPPAAGGLFGSLQKDKPSSNLFGSSLTTSQPHQSSSLFGLGNPQQSQGTGLFGSNTTSQPQSSSAAAGNPAVTQAGLLFSGSNMNTQQNSGGGPFGLQQQSNQPATSLFGATNPQSQPQQGGGIFASLGQNQTQQKPQAIECDKLNQLTLVLMRSAPTQSQNQGQQQNQQSSIFATSIGQYSQQQRPIPGVRVSTSELRPTTRFTDLHEHLQTLIANIDDFVQQQMKYQQECVSLNPSISQDCNDMPNDVDHCTKALETMETALENDAGIISQAKSLTKGDVGNANLCFSAIENMAIPQQYQTTNLWALPSVSREPAPSLLDDENSNNGTSSLNLLNYFTDQADDMSNLLHGYQRNIGEVEAYLKGIEGNTIQQMQQFLFTRGHDGQGKSAEDQVRELAAVLKEFENSILNVAGKVGGVREKMTEVMLGDHGSQTGRSKRFAPL